jgi:hypothetical protein
VEGKQLALHHRQNFKLTSFTQTKVEYQSAAKAERGEISKDKLGSISSHVEDHSPERSDEKV